MTYTFNTHRLPKGRIQLAKVIQAAGDLIGVETAAHTLGLTPVAASKRLARWTEQGWLRRVAHGNYVPVSLDSVASERVLDDPWVLIPTLYSPAYVGGRTAAEHWDLTEQIFKDVVVLTARPIRKKKQEHHGALFTVKHIQQEKIFGTQAVWRHRTKISISDVHRTIIDMLNDPALGGGIQHVADCLAIYLSRPDKNTGILIQYAERLGNGAVFKRLGFLLERSNVEFSMIEECRKHITTGNAKLDPSNRNERLVSQWHLWIPRSWSRGVSRD